MVNENTDSSLFCLCLEEVVDMSSRAHTLVSMVEHGRSPGTGDAGDTARLRIGS